MSQATVILIAAPDLVPALRERLGEYDRVVTFADSEPVRAMKAILAQRPGVVALERLFAATPRGAAIIARIKADPRLDGSEIRILSHDSGYQRVSPRRLAAPPRTRPVTPAGPLDPGNRRAPRFAMKESALAAVGGQAARLVNLSVVGAQLIAAGSLRTKHAVTVTLGLSRSPVVLAGTVVWARAELSRRGPASRVGVEFKDPDHRAIEAFIDAHRRR